MIHSENSSPAITLDEHQSKELLKTYGIPTVSENKTTMVSKAAIASLETGFPVVLKALGKTLLHKSDKGLVRLNLNSEAEVVRAAKDMAAACGDALEGYLIQPQLTGRREFVAGMVRDPQFGPTVMFGLGGIYTEALSDVVFRVAPLDRDQAGQMLDEIRAANLLGPFRGEAPVNKDQLVRTLMSLSRIGMEHPDIQEIDINPLMVDAKGNVCAVDALVVKSLKPAETRRSQGVDASHLVKLFNPKSVAVVGASSDLDKWGGKLFSNLVGGGYEGDIYLVNAKGGQIYGRKAYKSVEDIPGSVDMAIVAIPSLRVPSLMPGFEKKNIRHMLLITSGFGETGEQGRGLEAQLLDVAAKAGVMILGPNTMGIANPHAAFTAMGTAVFPRPGSTAVVAQSGNMGAQLLAFADQQNIGIRVYCGSGNESMISIEDYMDAFAQDDMTRTVVLYIEGVKDGRRFIDTGRKVSRKKPILLLKGGRTPIGTKAAASHTGAMVSDGKIFDAACRQAGIVTVTHPMDLLDLAAAFSSLPLPKGNRVAVMTLGGGWGVITADLCSDYGMQMPGLSDGLIQRFNELLPEYWSQDNPVDIVGEGRPDLHFDIMIELVEWDGCDAVIHLGTLGRRHLMRSMLDNLPDLDPNVTVQRIESVKKELKAFEDKFLNHIVRLMEVHEKPVLGVSILKDVTDKTLYEIDDSPYKGVVFNTPEQAVKVVSKMWDYQRFLS